MSDASKEAKDLGTLLAIAKAFETEHDLDKLLQLIVQGAVDVTQAERGTVYLYDPETDELYTRVVTLLEIREIRQKLGTGIAGVVAETLQPLNIPDASNDPRHDPNVDRLTGFHTRNMLTMPLLDHKSQLVGVIQVLNKRDGTSFDSRDEELLEAMSVHAAIAINNVRLIEAMAERERMAAALEIAKDIQQNLFPREPLYFDEYAIAGLNLPCDETGGDYYDFLTMPDGRIAIIVGDVSGHGVGSALVMSEVRALFHALLGADADLVAVVKHVNAILHRDLSSGRFVTLFAGLLDPQTHTISYVSAGHSPPIVADLSSWRLQTLDSTTLPLGILPDLDVEACEPVPIPEPGLVLCYTDGLVERMNESREAFGMARLMSLLEDVSHLAPQEIVVAVEQAEQEFAGSCPRADDVTLVAVKRQAKV